MNVWTLHFDGLCEAKNPGGWMAWAWVLDCAGQQDVMGYGTAKPHPANTNNVAEWYALGCGLKAVNEAIATHGAPDLLSIKGDSKLVVCQLDGSWRCNVPHLADLRDKCLALLKTIPVEWGVEWVPREDNERADALTVEAYEKASGQKYVPRVKQAR